MEKRNSQRSAKLLAAAVASVGLAGFGASTAHSSLVVDVRATSVAGQGLTGSNTSKSVLANVGDTIVFNVVVRVSGTNATQLTGNFDNAAPATDTRNDDSLQSLAGAFNSVGPAKMNFQGGVNSNQGNGNAVFPYGAGGSTNGSELDFDSDGDLDLGTTGTDPTNMWVVRAAGPQSATVAKKNTGTRFGLSTAGQTGGAAAFNEDAGGPSSGTPAAQIIDATTAEWLVGELSMVVTGGTGTSNVNFIIRATNDAGASLWFEDGSTTGKSPGNSPFAVGAPVQVTIPEPSTLGLMGLAALGLISRRKKQS
jgi:hypothetical protein